jgi:hypothetical protein
VLAAARRPTARTSPPPAASQRALEHRRRASEAARELRDEPRLADAGEPSIDREPRARRAAPRVVDGQQPRSSSSRPTNAAAAPRSALERQHAEGAHALGASLQREGARPAPASPTSRTRRSRRLADQHVAVPRLLLQAGGDVQRVADAAACSSVTTTSPVFTATRRPVSPTTSRSFRANSRKASCIATRRADGADALVLRDERHAERAHDAVAQELDDGCRRAPRCGARTAR